MTGRSDVEATLARACAMPVHEWSDGDLIRIFAALKDAPPYRWQDRVRYAASWRPRWVMRVWHARRRAAR